MGTNDVLAAAKLRRFFCDTRGMVQCTVSESRMERPGPVSLRGVTGPAGSWLRRYQSARGVAAVAI